VLGERCQTPREVQSAVLERLPETRDELATKDLAENVFGEEEARVARVDPVRVITRKAAGSDHAVNVGVMLQLLVPGMEDAEETYLGPKCRESEAISISAWALARNSSP
jgi:hypothetical protein